MKYILYLYIIIITFFSADLSAFDHRYAGKAPQTIEPVHARSAVFTTNYTASAPLSNNYTAIDTMANAIPAVDPHTHMIAYDPNVDAVVIAYCGSESYAAGGAGAIYYAWSPDRTEGMTEKYWFNRIGPLNAGVAGNRNGYHPSITLSNPTQSKSKDSVFIIASIPIALDNGSYALLLSFEPGLGARVPMCYGLDTSRRWNPSFPSCASTTSGYVIVAATDQSTNDIVLFRSSDQGVNFSKKIPVELSDAKFIDLDNISDICYQNKNFYIGLRARFRSSAPADTGTFTFGVSISSDQGLSWSAFDAINWHSIAALSRYDYNLYANDFAVDGTGGMHFLATFVDTSTSPALWSLFDLYKPAAGVWTALKVTDLPVHENWRYGTMDRTINEPGLSLSSDGGILIAKWLEDTRGTMYKDSTPAADMYITAWMRDALHWGDYKINVTNSPGETDQLTQICQTSSEYGIIFFTRNMEAGKSLNPSEKNKTVAYFGTWRPPIESVKNRLENPASYGLEQNYPNPFNPSTTISYSLPQSGDVRLVVSDYLGREVAVLAEGYKAAGTYDVRFDASKLASGVYFYSIRSGNYTAVKRMMLLK